MGRPLDGVKVVDFSNMLMAPYATQELRSSMVPRISFCGLMTKSAFQSHGPKAQVGERC